MASARDQDWDWDWDWERDRDCEGTANARAAQECLHFTLYTSPCPAHKWHNSDNLHLSI